MMRTAAWSVVPLLLAMSVAAQVAVIDVSGHPQDLIALTVLLKASTANVKLVTTHGNTAASLYAVTENVRELVNMLGRTDVAVVAGGSRSWQDQPERRASQPSDSQQTMNAQDALAAVPRTTLPSCTGNRGIGLFPPSAAFPSFASPVSFGKGVMTRAMCDTLFGVADALPVTQPSSPMQPGAAAAATAQIIAQSSAVNYIALGSLTNIAETLRLMSKNKQPLPSSFAVHINGGSRSIGNLQEWLGLNVTGLAQYAPGVDPRSSAHWNHFVDPAAASFVFGFPNLKRFLYTVDVQSKVAMQFTSADFKRLTSGAMDRAAQLRASGNTVDAAALEFVATLIASYRAFVQQQADPNCFDRNWFTLGHLFVAANAADANVRSMTVQPIPGLYQVAVAPLDGRLTLTPYSNAAGSTIPTSTYETAQTNPLTFWYFVNSALNLPPS